MSTQPKQGESKPSVKDKTRQLVLSKGYAQNGQPTVTIYESEYNELKIIQGNSGVDYQSINEAFDVINSNIAGLQNMIFNTKRSMLLAVQGYSITREGAIIPMTPPEQPITQDELDKPTAVETQATAVTENKGPATTGGASSNTTNNPAASTNKQPPVKA